MSSGIAAIAQPVRESISEPSASGAVQEAELQVEKLPGPPEGATESQPQDRIEGVTEDVTGGASELIETTELETPLETLEPDQETPGEQPQDSPLQSGQASEDSALDEQTPDDLPLQLQQLQQSAELSLQDALAIVESAGLGTAEQARSAAFIGELEQPIIAIEAGMQAIAIDAKEGEVLRVQDISEIPDQELLAAVEAANTLKSFAKVTLKEALQAAEGFAGQEPQQVALGLDEGSLVYRATVAGEQIFIDAGDAQVLYSSSDNFEAAEKPRGSIQLSESDLSAEEMPESTPEMMPMDGSGVEGSMPESNLAPSPEMGSEPSLELEKQSEEQ